MSEPELRDKLAELLAELIAGVGGCRMVHGPVDELILDGNDVNLLAVVDTILSEFLVVPRSEVAIETHSWGRWGMDELAARQRETWTGPWTPIPLPEVREVQP